MESVSWDAVTQLRELNAMKGRQDLSLTLSGSVLGLTNAVLLAEALGMNEDTNTFLLLGLLSLVISLSWLVFASRAAKRGTQWARKASRIEEGILAIPAQFSVWDESGRGGAPAWIAVAGVLVSFSVVWVGLVGYALYWQAMT